MTRDVIILGAELPTLIPLFLITALLMWLIDRQCATRGLYDLVWHPALFRSALFLLLFTLLALLIY